MNTESCDIRALLIDGDGVLYLGNRALPGADRFLAWIAPLPWLILSNNSSRSPRKIGRRLERIGFGAIDPERILTSAQATAIWLENQRKGFRYFCVGGEGLQEALAEKGIEDPRGAEFVVVGEGPGLTYANLVRGLNLILDRGATLVATNPDPSVDGDCDGNPCVLPGGGALVAPFALASGREPVVIGKPGPLMFEIALARLGCAAKESLMIGDRPDTDIAGAASMGLRTALVRTGRFPPGAPWPEDIPRPDWDMEDLPALQQALRASCPGLGKV